jgi:hypothetical protein
MSRNIRIIKTGTGSNGRPFARGVVDFEGAEQLAMLQLATSIGARPASAAFGLVNGIPDDAMSKLQPGDTISAEQVSVTFRRNEYEDGEGAKHVSLDASIRLAGKASRVAAPTAECDW